MQIQMKTMKLLKFALILEFIVIYTLALHDIVSYVIVNNDSSLTCSNAIGGKGSLTSYIVWFLTRILVTQSGFIVTYILFYKKTHSIVV